MTEINNQGILKKIAAMTAEIGSIGKTNKNGFQNYNFRSVAQAMAALQPLLVKHGVIIQPCYQEVLLHPQDKGFTATCMLNLTFYDTTDGSSIMVRVPGQGSDAGDKALGKAMAMAFKYAVFQTMSVPEDGIDSEYESPEVKPAAKKINTNGGGTTPRSILG